MPDYFRAGMEFAINTNGVGEQNFPRVTRFPNGNFIVVWQTADSTQDGSGGAIKAQIFASDGTKIGGEFLVNNQLGSTQDMADVAVLDDGSFVITWHTIDATQDGNSGSIKARAFDPSGTALGPEFLVNTDATGNQYRPEIMNLAGGGYVITWLDANTNVGDVKGQVFSAAGVKIGSEFLVNNSTASMQSGHSITSLSNGGFALAWQTGDATADGNSSAVRMRIFSATGVAIAAEFTANTLATGAQGSPDIRQLANGNIVVTWITTDPLQDGGGLAIKAQIFTPTGGAIGSEFLVNNLGIGDQDRPNVAVLADGGFMVTWSTTDIAQDGSGSAIKARVFDANGVPLAPEFLINGLATGNQTLPQIVQLPDGRVFVTWVSASGDGSNLAIRGQFLESNSPPVIISNGGGDTAAVSANENATSATTVTASGNNLSYSITGGADAALFAINATTGALSFINAPNFETPGDAGADNVYDVIVAVSDGTATDTQTLSITVNNANEAVTISSGASYSLSENALSVGNVTATDLDGDTISYTIAGGADAVLFNIDAVTGALSFVSAPNFENPGDDGGDNVYDVIVSASDGTLSDSRSVSVSVTNENEAVSITSPSTYATTENDIAVGSVTAFDLDGDNIGFAIIGGADAARFVIDTVTGLLSFIDSPDFEAPVDADGDNVYDVIVAASDGILTDSRSLAVTVSNANEAPTITSNGGGASASVTVAENGNAATIVQSTDPDGNSNSYAIVGGADAARFAINATTGALTFIAAPNFELPTDADGNNVYDVIVESSDGVLSDTQALSITVSNVNEAPVITSNGGGSSATIAVNENSLAVTVVTANDPEGTPRSFAIAGGADAARFTINSVTGALSFVAAPNYEAPTDAGANNIYDVVVTASDGVNVATQSIAVSINNLVDGSTINGNNSANTLNGTNAEDTINGLNGNDTINGGLGADRLTGGSGADRFVYTSVNQSLVGATDIITDFSRTQGDRISLAGIDARTTVAGDQAFSFIGNSAFSNVAGQLRSEQVNGNTFVSGDVNGDGVADFTIQVNGNVVFQSSDFIL
jgi:hypothetical protein